MNEKLKEYFLKQKNSNRMSHSFMIGNISFEKIKKDLEEIISKYIFEEDIKIESDPDIYIIKPENTIIIKDQILEMQNKIANTSINHGKKIYIIDSAETLNTFAANSLLKILEEPSKNIYAFLITKNIEMVIPTVKSRCQIVFISSENENSVINEMSEDEINTAIKITEFLENNGTHSIAYYNFFQKNDREKVLRIFYILLYIYRDAINYLDKQKLKYFSQKEIFELIIKNNGIRKLSDKLLIINDIIENLNYNLNINLVVDKFIIDFGGVG